MWLVISPIFSAPPPEPLLQYPYVRAQTLLGISSKQVLRMMMCYVTMTDLETIRSAFKMAVSNW